MKRLIAAHYVYKPVKTRFVIVSPRWASCHDINVYISEGGHGYDPRKVLAMHPFFIAFGPAFKKGLVSEPFDSVDIYPLMCYILQVKPSPNNGSLDNVRHILVKPPTTQESSFQFTTVTCMSTFIAIIM